MHLHHHGCRHGQPPPISPGFVLAFGDNAMTTHAATDNVSAPARSSIAEAIVSLDLHGTTGRPARLPLTLDGTSHLGDDPRHEPFVLNIDPKFIGAKTGACGGQVTP